MNNRTKEVNDLLKKDSDGDVSPENSSYCVESELFQSDGFHNHHNHDHGNGSNLAPNSFERRRKDILNCHLTNI